jgi:hypothetical protein
MLSSVSGTDSFGIGTFASMAGRQSIVMLMEITDVNVLFLDVDGVLNSERSFLAGASRLKAYEEENPNDPYWKKITKCTIDPVACEIVNRICRTCDVKIVVSSTHRMHFPDDENKLSLMKDYFGNLGINPELIIGWTERLHTIRGVEIEEWLDRHPNVNRYVILDDSSDMMPHQMEFFVRCDGLIGVSSANYFQMMNLFGREESVILTLG